MSNLQAAFQHADTYIRQHIEESGSPGLALALTDREGLLGVSTRGYSDFSAKTPIEPQMLFEIGSITKSFTALLLLQEWEAGRVDLDAPVEHYLPWFKVQSTYAPITSHHLLSHTAGIIRGSEFSANARCAALALAETVVGPAPGTVFHYSNVGYKVLGLILEAVVGMPYGEIVQERILDSLMMRATYPTITHEVRRQLAVGHAPLYDDRPMQADRSLVPATWLETDTADGSIASTVADMATYLRMLMGGGRYPGGRLLSEAAFKRLIKPVIVTGDGEHGEWYAYGLTVEKEDGHRLVGHSGGMVGYCCQILMDLDDGLGAVVMVNGPGTPEIVARWALRVFRAALHGEPLPPVPARVNRMVVEQAADYVGLYGDPPNLEVVVRGTGLAMVWDGTEIPLEFMEGDRFFAHHPDWQRFALRFGRQGGVVVELFHGSAWYPHSRYDGPRQWEVPAGWHAYPGHYSAYNPWYTNWRVVLRKGELVFLHPTGEEEPLVQIGESEFQAGRSPQSPERLRFETILEGQAIRANLSGETYYRTFTA